MVKVCLQVCVLCGEAAGREVSAGRRLYEALVAAASDRSDISIAPVECLAVCDRPVTLAFRATEGTRWSYLIGDADPAADVSDIIDAAQAVAASPHGVPAMDDRPPFFRKGVIARMPPAPQG